jgi:hypothetical protein
MLVFLGCFGGLKCNISCALFTAKHPPFESQKGVTPRCPQEPGCPGPQGLPLTASCHQSIRGPLGGLGPPLGSQRGVIPMSPEAAQDPLVFTLRASTQSGYGEHVEQGALTPSRRPGSGGWAPRLLSPLLTVFLRPTPQLFH